MSDTEILSEIIAEFDDLNLTSVSGGKLELKESENDESKAAKKSAEKPVETAKEKPAEKRKEKPVEKAKEKPVEEMQNDKNDAVKEKMKEGSSKSRNTTDSNKTADKNGGGIMAAKQKQRRGKGRRREDKKAPEFHDDEEEEVTENHQVEDDVTNLSPMKRAGRKLHFTKSPHLLMAYGITSILLGFAIAGCGVAAFFILPEFVTRHSFQVEWKWTNMILIFSGISAVMMTRKQTLTSISSTLVCSLLGACMGVCTAIVHIVNVTFRRKDQAYYQEIHEMDMYNITISVGTVNVFLVILGLISSGVSILLYRHALHIAGKNFGFLAHIDRLRLRLSGFGMAHIILGLLITAWWIAIETLFQGSGLDFHALPTSEVLAHGLVIVCTGYVQMMATSKGIQPLLVCASILNAASFFLVTFFSARPLSLIYLIFDMGSATTSNSMDIRFAIAAFLCLFYILEIMVSIYSLIRFLHYSSGDKISRIDNILERSHRLFSMTSSGQVILGLVYAILEVVTVGLLYAYKSDFSPLPLFIMTSGLFGLGALKMGSTLLISATIAVTSYCSACSFRDVYLFIYHAVNGPSAADGSAHSRPMEGGSLAFHFGIAVLALIELVLSIIMISVYTKTLLGSVTCLYNRIEHKAGLRCSKIIAITGIITSVLTIFLGLSLFVMQGAFLEVFGDYAITLGLYLLFAAAFSTASVTQTKRTILLLPALMIQLLCFVLIWQESDEYAYLVHYHLGWKAEQQPKEAATESGTTGTVPSTTPTYRYAYATTPNPHPESRDLRLGIATLLLIAFQWFLAGIWSLLQGGILETAQFQKLEMDSSRVEELVSMGARKHEADVEENGGAEVKVKAKKKRRENGHVEQNGLVPEEAQLA